MSNLIERLDKLITVGNAKFDAVDWEWESTIQEAIAALSPVLPDDVAELVNRLQEPYEQNQSRRVAEERQAADLLERQARNYESACRLMEMKDDDRDKLQQRIEELMVMEKDADHYRKLAEDRFDKCMAAEAQVKELEEELAQTEEAREAIDNSLHKVAKERDELQAQVKELEDYILSTDKMNTYEVLNTLDFRVTDLKIARAALQENE